MNKRIGIFAGSFDPIHYGHLDIINRACDLFDEVHVLVATNPTKHGLFTEFKRVELIEQSIKHAHAEGKQLGFTRIQPEKIIVSLHGGLLVHYVENLIKDTPEADHPSCIRLIRGVRMGDANQELTMSVYNNELGVDTILIPTNKEFAHLKSSAIKEIAAYDVEELEMQDWVAPPVYEALFKKIRAFS